MASLWGYAGLAELGSKRQDTGEWLANRLREAVSVPSVYDYNWAQAVCRELESLQKELRLKKPERLVVRAMLRDPQSSARAELAISNVGHAYELIDATAEFTPYFNEIVDDSPVHLPHRLHRVRFAGDIYSQKFQPVRAELNERLAAMIAKQQGQSAHWREVVMMMGEALYKASAVSPYISSTGAFTVLFPDGQIAHSMAVPKALRRDMWKNGRWRGPTVLGPYVVKPDGVTRVGFRPPTWT